jgi:hypothetical protein
MKDPIEIITYPLNVFNDMNNQLHIMTDIETLGTIVPTVVVEAAFMAFKLLDSGSDGVVVAMPDYGAHHTFTAPVSAQIKKGAVICPQTLAWWLTQSEPARERLAGALQAVEASGLISLPTWLGRVGVNPSDDESCRLWAKPASFDLPHLEWVLTAMGGSFPFHHRHKVCARTYCLDHKPPKDLREWWKSKHSLTAHDPVDDCMLQTLELAYVWGSKRGRF